MSSATIFGVEDLMKLHRGFVQRGEGKVLGRIVKIVLGEVPQGVPLKISPREITREGRTLDWFGQGPMLGLSPQDVDLLVRSPMTPLPPKPDADWEQPIATQAEIERAISETGKFVPAQAPLVEQKAEDRGARRIKGTNILIFEPVYQVLYRPVGFNTFGCVQGIEDQNLASVFTFVWNFDDGTGYFYGGRFMVKS
jgi:hypothetical protein